MNGDPIQLASEKQTWSEAFNAGLRGFVLIALVGVISTAYLWQLFHDKQVGTLEGAILNLTGAVFVWWFQSRDAKQKDDAAKTITQTTETNPTTGAQRTTISTGTGIVPPPSASPTPTPPQGGTP